MEFYGNYQVYSESGVDLTLLRENLKRTATARVARNLRALRFVAGLQRGSTAPGNGAHAKGPTMELDLEGLLRQLVTNGVQFVLVGGLAMRVRGSAHITEDLDICYARTPDNLALLVAALAPLHPYLRGAPAGLPFKVDVPTLQAGLNFTLITDLGELDLLGEVKGIDTFAQVVAASDEQDLFGMRVRVLSLDGLIVAKKAAGRSKDRHHLLELEELRKLRDANP
jgi:hypothetical protein